MLTEVGPDASSEDKSSLHTIRGAVVRFAGDSGDGVQVTGDQFTSAAALAGNDLATLPDYPAEIRAPAGTLYGVSGFQIQFGASEVYTPGDGPDVLVAMNPAALKTNIGDLKQGGLVVANSSSFTPTNLKKAGYLSNPLEDGSLSAYDVMALEIGKLTLNAVKPAKLSNKEAERCKNFWTLGLMFWIYDRPLDPTLKEIEKRYRLRPDLVLANSLALKAGNAFGETTELFHHRYRVPPAPVQPGLYRSINGNVALAWGLIAGAERCHRQLVLGSYPITPASDVLHELSKHRQLGVCTIQAEDEIAAVCAAIGASFAGSIGVTTTSGPGLALKTEAIGLAIAAELPLVVIDIQRGGPSTGLPTKTEQADLLQAIYGRNGESPLCVLAASTPSDCFFVALEAVRIAVTYVIPVIVLSDGYLANGAEPWRIPAQHELPEFPAPPPLPPPAEFHPYLRDDETLARPWVAPGTAGYEHRIGGLERDFNSGHISYDPTNHERMTLTRAEKIDRIARSIRAVRVEVGPSSGALVVVGWGSTFGSIREAVQRCVDDGLSVAHVHLTHLNPLPNNLSSLLAGFGRVLVAELNTGQLAHVLRATYLISTTSFGKVQGKPFGVDELEARIRRELAVMS